jgi:hypothetical protein
LSDLLAELVVAVEASSRPRWCVADDLHGINVLAALAWIND